jgi:hypothetical protein
MKVKGKVRRGREEAPIAQRSEDCVVRTGREVAAHGVLDLDFRLGVLEPCLRVLEDLGEVDGPGGS